MRKLKIILIVFVLSFLSHSAAASGANIGFSYAAHYYKIPKRLLYAICYVESGFHFYALDIDGYPVLSNNFGYSFDIGKYFINRGYSVDVGLMQVNYNIWGKRLKLSLKKLLITQNNIMAGAYILRHYYSRTGNIWEAVGRYHSGDPDRAYRYEIKVYEAYKALA
ncbi:MAG: lytic transglycosylase domain-containing protein [Deltaproteobacteria bacterium]|jgi:soluble lytic murein transglycosylase-like protein|nr:lytic transglycosylase domain-containing protein [Deltaproteobacteria bacterium]